jgi:hypothetical protein
MHTLDRRMGMLALLGAGVVAVGACGQRSEGADPRGASGAVAEAAGAGTAVWEPIDREFKGCEGG